MSPERVYRTLVRRKRMPRTRVMQHLDAEDVQAGPPIEASQRTARADTNLQASPEHGRRRRDGHRTAVRNGGGARRERYTCSPITPAPAADAGCISLAGAETRRGILAGPLASVPTRTGIANELGAAQVGVDRRQYRRGTRRVIGHFPRSESNSVRFQLNVQCR